VGLHPRTRTFRGFEWKGSHYFYIIAFPLGWPQLHGFFSKVMRELVMYWRRGGISVLPYLGYFFFSKKGSQTCLRLYRRVMQDFYDAGLIINVPKCLLDPALCLRQPGFDVDMGEGEFRVPIDRWEALRSKTDAILSARGRRMHALKLSSLTGAIISMKLAWGPVTQLYTRHMYVLINSAFFLNCWVSLSDEARGDLLF